MDTYRVLQARTYALTIENNSNRFHIFSAKNYSVFVLDDYSTHLVPQVNAALLKGGYIFVEIGGGITGNVQVNNLDLHSKLKIVSRSKNLW